MSDLLIDILGDKKPKAADDLQYAVVMVGDIGTTFVFGRGWGPENDQEGGLGMEECGPAGCAPEAKGLWIWEGIPYWHSGWNHEYGCDEGAEPDYSRGNHKWRRPTTEEAVKIAMGDFSFFGEEWLHRGAPSDRTPLTTAEQMERALAANYCQTCHKGHSSCRCDVFIPGRLPNEDKAD